MNERLWIAFEFALVLAAQQTTHWVASRGREIDPSNSVCEAGAESCDGTGVDPGRISPLPSDFTGELLCVETDASGAPWSGNALSGQVTLIDLESGAVEKYRAAGIPGLQRNDADNVLCLGSADNPDCPPGGEYRACPSEWIVSHPADYDDRQVDGDASKTGLTIVPCGQNFEDELPATITLQVQIINELEQTFSASTTVTCWGDFRLGEIGPLFERDSLSSDWVQTRIRTTASSAAGFLVIQRTVHETARPQTTTAVATVAQQGDTASSDLLILQGGGE